MSEKTWTPDELDRAVRQMLANARTVGDRVRAAMDPTCSECRRKDAEIARLREKLAQAERELGLVSLTLRPSGGLHGSETRCGCIAELTDEIARLKPVVEAAMDWQRGHGSDPRGRLVREVNTYREWIARNRVEREE